MANAAHALPNDALFIKFTHAAHGSPAISTLTQAVRRGYLHTYPCLTLDMLVKHPPLSMATAKGHLDQHRQGLRSTHVPLDMFDIDNASDTAAIITPQDDTASSAYTQIILASTTLHSDMTGRFPVTSRTGAQYMFVSVLDGYIHVEPMKTRHHQEYIAAYKRTLNFFGRLGRRPSFQRLDNETSAPLEAFAIANNIDIQYCPPHTHRSLKAERAIRTFKNHFIATLCTAAPDFPLNLWDDMLPQLEICLNHLLPYTPNVTVSAYAGIHGGAFDFAKHPIAPIGTRILIHDKPTSRASWAPHGVPGFYLGPALQHYRSYRAWATATNTMRITDTVAWFPHDTAMPGPTIHDILIRTIDDLHVSLTKFSAAAPNLRKTAQPTSLITSIADNLRTIANMHIPPPTQVSSPTAVGLTDPAAEQRVVTPQHAHSSVPDADTSAHGPNRPFTAPPVRPTVPLPPTLYAPRVANNALNLDDAGQPLTYASAKAGSNAPQWQIAEIEELDRLLRTETIRPMFVADQPLQRRRDTTYYNPQTKEKETTSGERTFRIRGTIGGDRVNYPGPTTARTAAMLLVKILIHSVVSDKAQWLTIDIKDFYLNTPLPRPEYLRIPSKFLTSTIITDYKLSPYLHNNAILFEVNKGMYGLPQAGLLAQQRLLQHLSLHGYHQTDTSCLFRHESNGTVFSLVVDDFGVKYTDKKGADHLIHTLQMLYPITVDWSGAKYLGFSIAFDRTLHTVTLTMPHYIDKVLQRFAPSITHGANSPAVYIPPHYGVGIQTPTLDTSTPLSSAETTTLQELVGSLLYYARGVDVTILPAVTHLSSLQAHPTQDVLQASRRLLAYCARYPNNALRYHACNMVLHIQSDASYLSRPNARSVAGAIFYLGNADQPTHINGSVHSLSTIIPAVVASVAEAEYAALFLAAQDGVWLRQILNSLGYPQNPTTILCDNQCAVGIALDTIKPKRTKSIDMRFHWIRDRIAQNQFIVTWRKGADNLADFFTKPLPVHVHQSIMPLLVHIPSAPPNALLTPSATRAVKWQKKPPDRSGSTAHTLDEPSGRCENSRFT